MSDEDTKAWIKRRNADVRAKRSASASPSRSSAASSLSSVIKPLAGSLAEEAGTIVGAAKVPAEAAQFAIDVLNPLYRPLHGGRPAAISLAKSADKEIRQVWSAAHHPLQSIQNGVARANVALNPSATPVAPTITGETRRMFDIGQNQGEVAFDIGMSAAFGPEAMAPRTLTAEEQVAKSMAQGMNEREARYLTKPYKGEGHHYWPRRGVLGLKLPKAISDSPFNVLKPPGISQGEMYGLHYEVDPKFNHARLPNHVGKSWKGKALGLKKDHPLIAIVRGAPTALKRTATGIGGGVAGVAKAAHQDYR